MDIDIISQYILSITPAVTAILTAIASVIIGIKNIKSTTTKTIAEVKQSTGEIKLENVNLKKKLNELSKENIELKHQMNEVLARMKHMYFVEEEDVKKEK